MVSSLFHRVIVALALLVLLPACARNKGADETQQESQMESSTVAGDTGNTGLTGVLSEDAFKALHQLRTEPSSAARGTMIQVAGERAYLSLPEGATPGIPGVVVIQEWWGLNDHIKHWSDRLAADGYAALAVDLYGGRVADNADSAMAYMKAVDKARALEILKAGHAFLATDPRIQAKRRGSIGWCFGGGMSLQLALNAPDLDAAVIYYGHPVTDPKALQAIHAHILGIFGNADQSIPPGFVNEFETALTTAGVQYQILRYDADHAFANPSGNSYDQADAAAAWEKTRAFLAKHLKQG
jgi:carboxymethylenebutenolidase